MKRFHWHNFQIDPFIDCYETNYIYIAKAEWNQTDRPKSDKEEIREFDSPLKGVTPFIPAQGYTLHSSWSTETSPCWNKH